MGVVSRDIRYMKLERYSLTCLWLKGLPPLKPTKYVEPRIVSGKKRWGNQTDSGQNKMTPSDSRGHDRSLTPQGWADAMAGQWG